MCYRCHGDMLPEASDPGTLVCQICGYTAEQVEYDDNEVARLFYEEIREKAESCKKSSSNSGRTRKKQNQEPTRWYAWDRQETDK